eukprot:Partr_v1_DN28382_c3_g1_i7_m78677 putative adaptor-related protein complex 3 sigma
MARTLTIKIVYRHYATLFFIFVVDDLESELGILDLIQVFVECLDRLFQSVRELDLIYHPDQINYVLNEMIIGGMVCESMPPFHLNEERDNDNSHIVIEC